jgi:hypothetical protein
MTALAGIPSLEFYPSPISTQKISLRQRLVVKNGRRGKSYTMDEKTIAGIITEHCKHQSKIVLCQCNEVPSFVVVPSQVQLRIDDGQRCWIDRAAPIKIHRCRLLGVSTRKFFEKFNPRIGHDIEREAGVAVVRIFLFAGADSHAHHLFRVFHHQIANL